MLKICITQGVQRVIKDNESISLLLEVFANGEFGNMPSEDIESNLHSIANNCGIVMGSYEVNGEDVWIIAHLGIGGYITVLLPEEY